MVKEYSDKELKKIRKKIHRWIIKFSKSKYFEELTKEQTEEAEFVISSFAEFMYSYQLLSPEEWDEDGLEECCLDVIPRKVSADESYFRSIAPVLSAFFSFTEEKGLLRNASRLARRVKKIDNQIVKNASNPKNWGMAKSFAMTAKQAGFDITDEKEMERFIALYNLYQHAKSTSKPKIGRNDPCPCGSGKKYKKCCGR